MTKTTPLLQVRRRFSPSRPTQSSPGFVGSRDPARGSVSTDLGARIQRADLLGHHIARLGAGAIQPKLTLGPVGDRYEQEADQVAREVVGQLSPSASSAGSDQAQRMSDDELLDDDLQRMPVDDLLEDEESARLQPIDDLEDDELMAQAKAEPGMEGGGAIDGATESAIQQARGGGQPMGADLRTSMEGAFGADFSGVTVHTDAHSDQLNQSLQAKAFTTGSDVFFRQGEFDPKSGSGQELIAHELTHVVQQGGAKVQEKPEE